MNKRRSFTQTWIIWGILVAVVLIPLIKPIGLPVGQSPETEAAFQFVEKIPAGSLVMIINEVAPSNAGENWPQVLAVARHHIEKGHKLIVTTFIPDGSMYSNQVRSILEKEYNIKYGEDLIVLPYRAGKETAVAALADNIRGIYKEDEYKNNLDSLPLWSRVKSIKDFAVVSAYTSGDDTWWIVRHIYSKYQVPCFSGNVSVATPENVVYFKNGQIVGMLGGIKGAAYYEQRLGKPDQATRSMDAQSAGHIYLLGLMTVSNVVFFYGKKKSRKEERA